MKKSSAFVLFSAMILNIFFLSGCHDETAQVEPNNWNCRQDDTSGLAHRAEELEHDGKIDNAAEFIEHCQQDKLGLFSDDYENLNFSDDYKEAHDRLFAKWKREAR